MKGEYKQMNKKIRIQENNAITLIALVITIVILIILAGVAVNLSLGENGIFNRAKIAREQYKMAEVKEKIEANLKYPGTIKITVIRETRAQEEAK